MVSKISEGVTISVETFYQPDYSNPLRSEYMFAYRITIENNNSFPVKLLRRHWYIFDSDSTHREVEGEGVIGNQPQINSGENTSTSAVVIFAQSWAKCTELILWKILIIRKRFT